MICHEDCRCHRGCGLDISFVRPWLAVGGMVHPDEIHLIKALGVTHILSVNWPDRPEYPEVVRAFEHCDLPIVDDALPKPAEWFRSGAIFAFTIDPSIDKLLIHCAAGVNRSPAMAYGILRLLEGLPPDVAEHTLRYGRPATGGGTFEVYRKSADAWLDGEVS